MAAKPYIISEIYLAPSGARIMDSTGALTLPGVAAPLTIQSPFVGQTLSLNTAANTISTISSFNAKLVLESVTHDVELTPTVTGPGSIVITRGGLKFGSTERISATGAGTFTGLSLSTTGAIAFNQPTEYVKSGTTNNLDLGAAGNITLTATAVNVTLGSDTSFNLSRYSAGATTIGGPSFFRFSSSVVPNAATGNLGASSNRWNLTAGTIAANAGIISTLTTNDGIGLTINETTTGGNYGNGLLTNIRYSGGTSRYVCKFQSADADRFVIYADGSGTFSGALTIGGTIQSATDMTFKVDSDNNGTNVFYWQNGAGTNIMQLSEIGSLTFIGDLVIGSDSAGWDYSITFKGENSDGILKWWEDEAYLTINTAVVNSVKVQTLNPPTTAITVSSGNIVRFTTAVMDTTVSAISNGSFDGQRLTIVNTGGGFNVILDPDTLTNCSLSANPVILGTDDIIELIWDATSTKWRQVSLSTN